MSARHLFRERMMCSDLLEHCTQLHRLSREERNIIMSLVRGMSPTEIASIRGCHIKTISTLKRNAFLKMKVSSDIELIHYLYFLKSNQDPNQPVPQWCLSADKHYR
ncbi:helix-turn-helix transcriptional regulator [uncultured Citrobacter sp.]|uniref:helix-turn-helix domain-containing protein n=1 Tax=uncultured Citrobacter sp. TaxID=200446 RepID=UPI00338D47E5